ncbi:hypothetical protein NPIL_267521 [Nephila pilipes]|uniref:Uncharacterized protein n=1 Tax=Nephila pilipes TaxID=299642 RepID=A0A8X6T3U8_NEPPI|nr:hypothetical protein NPIL_267521 [Nephila pilipes]
MSQQKVVITIKKKLKQNHSSESPPRTRSLFVSNEKPHPAAFQLPRDTIWKLRLMDLPRRVEPIICNNRPAITLQRQLPTSSLMIGPANDSHYC